MGYIVRWKDGTSSEMDDKQFENMPKEMESEIGKISQTTTGLKAAPRPGFVPGAQSSVAQHRSETKYRAGDAYTTARSALSVPIGAIMGGLEYGKDRLFNEGSWAGGDEGQPISKYMADGMELGSKGEGATGLLATPTNYLPGFRAANVYAKPAAQGLPWTFVREGSSGMLPNVFRAGVTGGVYGALDSYENARDMNATGLAQPATDAATTSLLGAGLSGVFSTMGRYGKGFAANQYPNYTELTRTALERGGKPGLESMEGAIRGVMGGAQIPYRQSEVLDAIDVGRRAAGRDFDAAVAAIPETRELRLITTPDGEITAAHSATGQPLDFGADLEHQLYHPRDVDVKWNADKVRDIANAQALADLRSSTIHKVNSAAVDKAVDARIKDLEYKLGVQKGKYPDMPAGDQMDIFGVTGDIKDIADFSKLRRAYSSQFKNSANLDERVANYADELVHGGIVGSMERIPEYSEAILRSGAKQKYATYKALDEMANKRVPVPTGIARTFPTLLNNYVGPVSMYRAANFLENQAPRLGAGIVGRGTQLMDLIRSKSDTTGRRR